MTSIEEAGRVLGITDRAILGRAADLALLVTRTCGRLPPADEHAKPWVCLELACQAAGQLALFNRDMAAKHCGRTAALFARLSDGLVNALAGSADIVQPELLFAHFGCTEQGHFISSLIERSDQRLHPRVLLAAASIAVCGAAGIKVAPLAVAEYCHVAWRDCQPAVRVIRDTFKADLEQLQNTISVAPTPKPEKKWVDNPVLKDRAVPFLLDGKAGGIYGHIGLNLIIP